MAHPIPKNPSCSPVVSHLLLLRSRLCHPDTSHLPPQKTIQSSEFWWCGSSGKQSRHSLFVNCRAWHPQIKELWKSVGKACKTSTGTLRQAASRTSVRPRRSDLPAGHKGRGVIALAPPEEEWEEELEGVELWAEEGGAGWRRRGRRAGAALRMRFPVNLDH